MVLSTPSFTPPTALSIKQTLNQTNPKPNTSTASTINKIKNKFENFLGFTIYP